MQYGQEAWASPETSLDLLMLNHSREHDFSPKPHNHCNNLCIKKLQLFILVTFRDSMKISKPVMNEVEAATHTDVDADGLTLTQKQR